MKLITQILLTSILLIPSLLHSATPKHSATRAPAMDSQEKNLNFEVSLSEKKRFGSVYAEIEKNFRKRATSPEQLEQMLSELRYDLRQIQMDSAN